MYEEFILIKNIVLGEKHGINVEAHVSHTIQYILHLPIKSYPLPNGETTQVNTC